MSDSVREVSVDLLIRASSAAVEGPRGYENVMLSVVKALAKEVSADDLVAVSYRLHALGNLRRDDADLSGFTMSLHGKDYKLIDEAAFRAAAVCPLSLPDTMAKLKFDREQFSKLVLFFADFRGNA